MCGISKPGFTLIEILVVIAVIAAMATLLVPNFARTPYYERQQFIRKLNALSLFAWQQSIITQKTHKIAFNLGNGNIHVEVAGDKKDDKGEEIFTPVRGAYLTTTLKIPKNLVVKNFAIEGVDEMERGAGGRTTEVWYYIAAGGRAQAVVINLSDAQDKVGNKPRPVGLVLNPYSAIFKEYATFQKIS